MSDLTDMVIAEVREMQPIDASTLAANLGINLNTSRTVLRALERQGVLVSDDYHRATPVYLLREDES